MRLTARRGQHGGKQRRTPALQLVCLPCVQPALMTTRQAALLRHHGSPPKAFWRVPWIPTKPKVMWVGYYDMPADASYGFDRCNDELEAIRPRLEAMAFSLPDVWYVSADEVIDPTEPNADDFIDDDRVHPSIAGSDRIGKLVADAILAAEQA